MAADDSTPILYDTGRALTTFHPFLKLPCNIRSHIIALVAPEPRTRFLELFGYEAPSYTPKIRYIPRLPPLFHVSRETRSFSITHEGGSLIHFFAKETKGRRFYFNFGRDTMFLSSRFTPSGKSTETFRLRELSTLLAPPFLSNLRRVVVTYSSLDDYKAIGCRLRPYVSLEKLYIAMSDWWSDRRVKTLLRNGKPQVGYVTWKIETYSRIAEGDETDDEEESQEEYERRIRFRQKRRVVECELWLDE